VYLPVISSPHDHIDLVHPPCSGLLQNTSQFQHNCGQYILIYFPWSQYINLFLSSSLTICHCLSFVLYNSCGSHNYASILFAWSPPVSCCCRLYSMLLQMDSVCILTNTKRNFCTSLLRSWLQISGLVYITFVTIFSNMVVSNQMG
jgi:hypothetical protein